MKEALEDLVKKFNERKDPRKDKVRDLKRSIMIKFTDNGIYHLYLEHATLSDIEEGEIEADIIVETDTKTFMDILNKKEDALTAYITKKIRIKAKLMDKLLLSELLRG